MARIVYYLMYLIKTNFRYFRDNFDTSLYKTVQLLEAVPLLLDKVWTNRRSKVKITLFTFSRFGISRGSRHSFSTMNARDESSRSLFVQRFNLILAQFFDIVEPSFKLFVSNVHTIAHDNYHCYTRYKNSCSPVFTRRI